MTSNDPKWFQMTQTGSKLPWHCNDIIPNWPKILESGRKNSCCATAQKQSDWVAKFTCGVFTKIDKMTPNDSKWLQMTLNDSWWLLMTIDDYWRLLTTIDDYWRLLMTIDDQYIFDTRKCDWFWVMVTHVRTHVRTDNGGC